MINNTIELDDGTLLNISSRIVSGEEKVLLSLNGENDGETFVASLFLNESQVEEVINALSDFIVSKRSL